MGRLGVATVLTTGVLIIGLSQTANAYTTESSVTNGCHEGMTVNALDAAVAGVGWPQDATAPPLSEYDRRIAREVAFELPDSARNPWALAMIMGNRHVDLEGHDPDNLLAIAREAALPNKQRNHCLRAADHDGFAGNRAAIDACRAFIVENVEAAMGQGDDIDIQATEEFEVALAFSGPTDLQLNRFGFRMGMALHALQDGFSHSLRTPDEAEVRHVLNYVDHIRDGYSEPRDGHQHMSVLDGCSGKTLLEERAVAATLASQELLEAVMAPAVSRAERLDRVNAALDGWFGLDTDPPAPCTVENDYCDAPELELSTGFCSAAGAGTGTGSSSPGGWMLSLLVPLALLLRSSRRNAARWIGAACLALGLGAAAPAQADDSEPGEEPAPATLEQVDEARSEQKEELQVNEGVGLYFGAGVAADEGAGIVALGIRWDVVDWLVLGLDGEYNPWFSLDAGKTSNGTVNVAAAAIFRYGTLGPVELRTTVHVGVSIMLADLVVAQRGDVGPFAGITPLGVAVRLNEALRLTVDPGGIYITVPEVQGVSAIRRQHRFMFGLRWTM